MKKLPELNLPPVYLRLRQEDNMIKVFDFIRKKYVALTPEEYVRQHFTNFLCNKLHYPASLTANEVSLDVNGMKKRCDTVVFNPDSSPLLIAEYKAPSVQITQNVFDQILRYNLTMRARYLIVSNGLTHFCAVIDYKNNSYNFIPSIPDYNDLKISFSTN